MSRDKNSFGESKAREIMFLYEKPGDVNPIKNLLDTEQ